jgi:hypothetical protein
VECSTYLFVHVETTVDDSSVRVKLQTKQTGRGARHDPQEFADRAEATSGFLSTVDTTYLVSLQVAVMPLCAAPFRCRCRRTYVLRCMANNSPPARTSVRIEVAGSFSWRTPTPHFQFLLRALMLNCVAGDRTSKSISPIEQLMYSHVEGQLQPSRSCFAGILLGLLPSWNSHTSVYLSTYSANHTWRC